MSHRVGLVGLRMAEGFIELFERMPGVKVGALCDLDRDLLARVGRERGIAQCFTDYEKMLGADIDMVALCTPIQVHGQQAIAAMQAGKHVLCQYVAANTPTEGDQLARVAKASGKKYMMIETDCYERANRVMMALARSGALGELTQGRGHYIHDCKTMGRNPDGSLTWRGEIWKIGHGGISAAVHSCLPLLHVFNERVVEVYAYGPGPRTLAGHGFNWSDRLTTVGKLQSGRFVEFVLDIFSWHPLTCGYQLQGTRGYFAFNQAGIVENDKLSPPLGLDELEQRFNLGDTVRDHGGHGSAWEAAVRQFVRAVDENTRPPEDLADALHLTAIGWAADESMETGSPVTVRTFDI